MYLCYHDYLDCGHTLRQKGNVRGPEKGETDRRIVRDRIALLKDKIKAIDKQMGTNAESWFYGSWRS
jgi:50S ribosomal subunit-associated GTPase HflX